MAAPCVICLTPVRNEAWILERFLAAAALWADHIVVADHGSTDGSREIAARHPKVTLIDYPSPEFDEKARREILVNAAREVTGDQRLLIALDADEALSASAFAGNEWERALSAAPGTALRWHWANLLPGGTRAWVPDAPLTFGIVDDGRAYSARQIHGMRVPFAPDAPNIEFEESVVLHFQYVDWERMKRKQAWYQCWETLADPAKRPAVLYRQYHHMDAVPPELFRSVDPAWLEAYRQAGIELTRQPPGSDSWRDHEILDWLAEHGPRRFAKIDMWGIDWSARARALGHPLADAAVDDPRSVLDRGVGRWLALTQRHASSSIVRNVDRGLRLAGW